MWLQFPDDAHTAGSGYICRYAQLITGWRKELNFVGKAGWLTVQIAPWLGPRAKAIFPSIRLAHQAVGDLLQNVATVVTHDLGDPLNPPPYSSMHPRNKTVVGDRLAAAALSMGMVSTFADPASDSQDLAAGSWGGPAFASIERTSPAEFTVYLTRSSGLHLVGSNHCQDAATDDSGATRPLDQRCCAAPDTFELWPSVAASELKTATTVTKPSVSCTVSSASVNGSLHCKSMAGPISSGTVWTFAWQNFPPCMLMNGMQLPASPMRISIPS